MLLGRDRTTHHRKNLKWALRARNGKVEPKGPAGLESPGLADECRTHRGGRSTIESLRPGRATEKFRREFGPSSLAERVAGGLHASSDSKPNTTLGLGRRGARSSCRGMPNVTFSLRSGCKR